MRLTIHHELSFTPPPGTGMLVMQLLLTPTSGPAQKVVSWSVEAPGIGNAGRFADAFGNTAHLVNQNRPEGPVTVTVRGVVDTVDTHGVLGRLAGEPVPALFRRSTAAATAPSSLHEALDPKGNRLELLHALMGRVGEYLAEDVTPKQSQMQADGAQSQSQGGAAAEPATAGQHAHLFIGAARALGIPARYVSGYRLANGDAALHAWAEAWDDGLGWIGFDPVLQLCPTDTHVRLAVGLDAGGATPLRAVPAAEVQQAATVTAE